MVRVVELEQINVNNNGFENGVNVGSGKLLVK